MKKILLILMVFGAFQATAQKNSGSIVLMENPVLMYDYNESYIGPVERLSPKNKKTRAGSGWMSYQEANYVQGVQSAALYPIYPDSNLYQPAGTPTPFYWYVHNIGTSFDPTSQKMYDGLLGYNPGFEIKDGNAFTIDSIEIAGLYRRRNNQTGDQLVIELTHTGSADATTLQSNDEWYKNNLGLADSTLRFATPVYDYNNNKMKTADVTITKTLDQAAADDTTTNGLNVWSLKLPTPLSVPAGEKVVATVRFVSGVAYPLGKVIDSANYWSAYTVESGGADSWPTPYTGEYATGLIAVTNDRYNITPGAVVVSGLNYMNSTYRWSNTAGFDDPYFSFYINCPTCGQNIGVEDVTALEGVKIFPNPSTGNVTISLDDNLLNQDMNIAVVDLSGKTIYNEDFVSNTVNKSIDLNNTAKGIYLYTVTSGSKVAHGKLIIE